MVSSSAIALYKAGVSESGRFTGAADAVWPFGPDRAVDRIREVLDDARRRGEIKIADCAAAARQFLAMLRGDLHLEVVFGLRAWPNAKDIHVHFMSVVAGFLRGAWPKGQLHVLRVATDVRSFDGRGSLAVPDAPIASTL